MLRGLQTAHHLQGAFIPDSPPLLLVKTTGPDATLERFSYYRCQGFFGASANLVGSSQTEVAAIACVPAGVEGFDTLAAERIRIVTVLGNRILDVLEVGKAPFAQVCKDAAEYQPDMRDNEAHYWEVLATFRKDDKRRLSAKDWLSVGWIRRYGDEMCTAGRACRSSEPPSSRSSDCALIPLPTWPSRKMLL